MTVNTTSTAKSYKPGSAMAAESLAGIKFLQSAHLTVTHESAETGVRTLLSEGSDYVISGSGADATGTITALRSYGANDWFHVVRATAPMQPTRIPPHEPLPAQDIEQSLDRIALIAQEQNSQLSDYDARSFMVPPGQTAGALSLTGLTNGDLLEYRDGNLRRKDMTAYAGQYGAIDSQGHIVGVDGGLPDAVPALAMHIAVDAGDPTGATDVQGWVARVSPVELRAKPGELVLDGSAAQHAAVNALLALLQPGQKLRLRMDAGDVLVLGDEIHLPATDAIGLIIDGGTVRASSAFRPIAIGAMTAASDWPDKALVRFRTGTSGQSLELTGGAAFDPAGYAKYCVAGIGASGVTVRGLRAESWRYGIYLASTAAITVRDILIEDFDLRNPGAVATYPINVTCTNTGRNPENVTLRNGVVEGSGVPFVLFNPAVASFGSPGTADQIAFQGVDGFLIENVESRGGGENGGALSICSRNGRVRAFRVSGADANGWQLGSTHAELEFAPGGNAESWAIGDAITDGTHTGTLLGGPFDYGDFIRWRVSPTASGFITAPGAITNSTKATSQDALRVRYVDDIVFDDECTAFDNGVGSSVKAGYYMTRARYIRLAGAVGNRDATSQLYAVYASSAIYDMGDLRNPWNPHGTAWGLDTGPGNKRTGRRRTRTLVANARTSSADAGPTITRGDNVTMTKGGVGIYTYTIAGVDLPAASADLLVQVSLAQTGDVTCGVTYTSPSQYSIRTYQAGVLTDLSHGHSVEAW